MYSVYDDSAGGRYVLTLPIFGRGNEVCGYMVLDISRDAVENTLSDISEEYRKQSAALGILCWLLGCLAADDDTSLQIKREAVPAGNSGDISGGVHAVRA